MPLRDALAGRASVEQVGPEELEVAGLTAAEVGDVAHARGVRLHRLAEVEQILESAYLSLTEDSVVARPRAGRPRQPRRGWTDDRHELLGRTRRAEWSRIWTVRSSRWFAIGLALVVLGFGTIDAIELAGKAPDSSRPNARKEAVFTAMSRYSG